MAPSAVRDGDGHALHGFYTPSDLFLEFFSRKLDYFESIKQAGKNT